jgi:hypothetical protein
MITTAQSARPRKSPDEKPARRCSTGKPRPFCALRGSMLPYADCLFRLEKYAGELGFTTPLKMLVLDTVPAETASTAISRACGAAADTVVVLKCRLPYEPSWGGYGGLARPLLLEKPQSSGETTTSHFIAPFLKAYQNASRQILLGRGEQNVPTVTLHDSLLPGGNCPEKSRLQVFLSKFATPDSMALLTPLTTSGPYQTYLADDGLVNDLIRRGFRWPEKYATAIGSLLSGDFFHFCPTSTEQDNDDFTAVLLPEMNWIVTDKTPQLRAAELYLQEIFIRCNSGFTEQYQKNKSSKLLIAALELDMRGFQRSSAEPYLVPWLGSLFAAGKGGTTLTQADLLPALLSPQRTSPA